MCVRAMTRPAVAIACALMALAAVVVVEAHMCLMAPPQRGGAVTLTGKDPRCRLTTAPCGGAGPEFPASTWAARHTSLLLVHAACCRFCC